MRECRSAAVSCETSATPLLARAFFAGLAAVMAGIAISFFAVETARPAAIVVKPTHVSFSDGLAGPQALPSGQLFLLGDGSVDRHALLPSKTDVTISVSGPIAQITVTQHFSNPGRKAARGTYMFPLPDGAVIGSLRVSSGDRVTESRIAPIEHARALYSRAKTQAWTSDIVAEAAPNIVTQSVTEIAPEGEIKVEIQYQQLLRSQ